MTITLNFDEKDIEDFLCKNNNLKFYFPDLKFIARQVKIDKFFIDILAYNKYDKCFYIIELKKGELNANAYTQAIKYKNLMSLKYKYKHKFKIILIGEKLNENLFYIINYYNFSHPYHCNNTYTLYEFDLENGISFCSYDTLQLQIESYLNERYLNNTTLKEIYFEGD